MWSYNYYGFDSSDSLSHYGVLGMKWGRRKDRGSSNSESKKVLNTRQQKKINKQYKKYMDRGFRKGQRYYNRNYVNIYNKTADYMNFKGINDFNSSQKKKYGDNYARRDGYTDDYFKFFDGIFEQNAQQLMNDFSKKSKDFNKAQELVEEYNMLDWSDLAKSNSKYFNYDR